MSWSVPNPVARGPVARRGPHSRRGPGRADRHRREWPRPYGDGGALERRTGRTIGGVAQLLGALPAIRERGGAFDSEELEPGLRCVAAPVFDHAGDVVAAVGISGSASRMTRPTRESLAAGITATAARISAALGAPQPPDRQSEDRAIGASRAEA